MGCLQAKSKKEATSDLPAANTKYLPSVNKETDPLLPPLQNNAYRDCTLPAIAAPPSNLKNGGTRQNAIKATSALPAANTKYLPSVNNVNGSLLPRSQNYAYRDSTLPAIAAPPSNLANGSTTQNATNHQFIENVRAKLVKKFKGREEDLVRILYFLAQEDCASSPSRPYSPHWDNLRVFLKESNIAFDVYVDSLLQQAKLPAGDETFRRTMEADSRALLAYSDQSFPVSQSQKCNLNLLTRSDFVKTSSLMGLANAWPLIPKHSKTVIMNLIRSYLPENAASAAQMCVESVEAAGGSVVSVALAAVHLSQKVYHEITRWWKGEISGARCSQNIVNDTFAIAAGGIGAVTGSFYGSVAGPVGAVTGALIGGVISTYCAQLIVDRLTQRLFGLPKSEALENAYNYLGVTMTASNNEINTAFRRLCLQHHPDKGGNKDEFLLLQCHMAVIKEARSGE